MKKTFLSLLAFCLLLSACQQRGTNIVIEGNFSHGGNALVRLSLVGAEETIALDSTKMKDGHFSFTLHARDDESRARAATPMLYKLDLGHNNAITTIAQGGQHLRFTADAANLVRTYRVNGGEEAILCCQLDSALTALALQAEEWFHTYEQNIDNDSVRADIERRYMDIVDAHTSYLLDFIQQHPHNLASYIAYYQSYNRRIFINKEENVALLQTLTENLKQQYPDNPYILLMQQRIEMKELQKQNPL